MANDERDDPRITESGRIADAAVADLRRTTCIRAGAAMVPVAGQIDAHPSTIRQPGLTGQGAGSTGADLTGRADPSTHPAVVRVGLEISANTGAVAETGLAVELAGAEVANFAALANIAGKTVPCRGATVLRIGTRVHAGAGTFNQTART